MTSLIMIVVTTALVNNVVLSQFLGICSFLGVSKQIRTSASLGGAVIFVITIASAVASLLYDYVLLPLDLDYLKTIVFILVIAALVQMVEMFLKKTSPAVYKALGIYLPLITTNCAVLGVALTNVQDGYNLLESVLAGFGTAVGYTVAIVLLAGIRGRLEEADVPAPFQGAPIVLLCAALMAIAFMGFSGLALS
ncbi:MAG: electron transport complex subunit RsxA [Eubacteriales bacterium]|nr:electron transport complex subunit RsxA [Eubacteriales bacterium]